VLHGDDFLGTHTIHSMGNYRTPKFGWLDHSAFAAPKLAHVLVLIQIGRLGLHIWITTTVKPK